MADYMLVFMLQKILSLSGLLWQNILLLCKYTERKRIIENRLAIFVFFMLCSVCCVQFGMCHLFFFFFFYRPGIWTTACWVIFNGSVWTQIFLKRCRGTLGKKDHFGTCGYGLILAARLMGVTSTWTVYLRFKSICSRIQAVQILNTFIYI